MSHSPKLAEEAPGLALGRNRVVFIFQPYHRIIKLTKKLIPSLIINLNHKVFPETYLRICGYQNQDLTPPVSFTDNPLHEPGKFGRLLEVRPVA